jgi:hypothetical protein
VGGEDGLSGVEFLNSGPGKVVFCDVGNEFEVNSGALTNKMSLSSGRV